MVFKVLVTRIIPPQTQARLLKQDFELIQWDQDSSIPRDVLLDKVKGVDALFCLLTEKIDDEVLDAAGEFCALYSVFVCARMLIIKKKRSTIKSHCYNERWIRSH